ncbi:DUF262 domain-containing protein [Mumia sp. Pv 4-285]|uniref:DUF262 domain-containing protein n=1 Tax=Mumia qirimensis TaxID=3234852 RepID=UPI00351D47B7
MRPNQVEAGHYLDGDVQLVVPAYQRPYEWNEERWVDLWRDLSHQYQLTASNQPCPAHYMGAVILETRDAPTGSNVHSFSAIDGQQRLLTLFVCLAAFRDHVSKTDGTVIPPDNELTTITPKYGAPCARLTVRPMNQAAMDVILRGECRDEIPDLHYDSPLLQAYRFFRWQFWNGEPTLHESRVSIPPKPRRTKTAPPRGSYVPWGPGAPKTQQVRPDVFHLVLTQGLKLLSIVLENDDEEASVIFETMNSKSTPLRQFDLLRNSAFIRMPTKRDAYYAGTWQPMEDLLTKVSYSALRTESEEQFLYEYMISLGEDKVSRESLHRRWVNRVIEDIGYAVTETSEAAFDKTWGKQIADAAAVYPIAVGQKQSVTIFGKEYSVDDDVFALIRETMALSSGPGVPLVLQALIDDVPPADLLAIVNKIESFLVRTILSGESLSPLRATMMGVAAAIDRPITPSKLVAALKDAGWKSNKQVLDAVKTVQLDIPGSVLMPILRGAERQLAGAGAHPMPFGNRSNQYSLEHIYPQTQNIGALWEAELRTWRVNRDDMDERRYVLGNFTAVTNYDNKRNGKKPFAEKKKLIVACAPLRLHDSVKKPSWRPSTIDARTELLTTAVLKRWPDR